MLFDMTHEELGKLFDGVASLADHPRHIEELSGGLTNRNLKVTTSKGTFVARCFDTSSDALAIDRDVEHHNTVAAAQAGVGAHVYEYRPDIGVMVLGFIPGTTLSRADFSTPGLIERVAASCRQLHAGPTFLGEFNMFERQAGYLSTVRREGFRVPEGYFDQVTKIEQMRRALSVRFEGLVPCNNDLLAENFVDDGEKIWLIDYEYSGNNDACFELGNIWTECRLDLEQLGHLVDSYYGEHRRSKHARARLLGVLGQYGWVLWGAIQNAVSPLDFDFWEWTLERHEIAMSELTGDAFARLLDDVQLPD